MFNYLNQYQLSYNDLEYKQYSPVFLEDHNLNSYLEYQYKSPDNNLYQLNQNGTQQIQTNLTETQQLPNNTNLQLSHIQEEISLNRNQELETQDQKTIIQVDINQKPYQQENQQENSYTQNNQENQFHQQNEMKFVLTNSQQIVDSQKNCFQKMIFEDDKIRDIQSQNYIIIGQQFQESKNLNGQITQLDNYQNQNHNGLKQIYPQQNFSINKYEQTQNQLNNLQMTKDNYNQCSFDPSSQYLNQTPAINSQNNGEQYTTQYNTGDQLLDSNSHIQTNNLLINNKQKVVQASNSPRNRTIQSFDGVGFNNEQKQVQIHKQQQPLFQQGNQPPSKFQNKKQNQYDLQLDLSYSSIQQAIENLIDTKLNQMNKEMMENLRYQEQKILLLEQNKDNNQELQQIQQQINNLNQIQDEYLQNGLNSSYKFQQIAQQISQLQEQACQYNLALNKSQINQRDIIQQINKNMSDIKLIKGNLVKNIQNNYQNKEEINRINREQYKLNQYIFKQSQESSQINIEFKNITNNFQNLEIKLQNQLNDMETHISQKEQEKTQEQENAREQLMRDTNQQIYSIITDGNQDKISESGVDLSNMDYQRLSQIKQLEIKIPDQIQQEEMNMTQEINLIKQNSDNKENQFNQILQQFTEIQNSQTSQLSQIENKLNDRVQEEQYLIQQKSTKENEQKTNKTYLDNQQQKGTLIKIEKQSKQSTKTTKQNNKQVLQIQEQMNNLEISKQQSVHQQNELQSNLNQELQHIKEMMVKNRQKISQQFVNNDSGYQQLKQSIQTFQQKGDEKIKNTNQQIAQIETNILKQFSRLKHQTNYPKDQDQSKNLHTKIQQLEKQLLNQKQHSNALNDKTNDQPNFWDYQKKPNGFKVQRAQNNRAQTFKNKNKNYKNRRSQKSFEKQKKQVFKNGVQETKTSKEPQSKTKESKQPQFSQKLIKNERQEQQKDKKVKFETQEHTNNLQNQQLEEKNNKELIIQLIEHKFDQADQNMNKILDLIIVQQDKNHQALTKLVKDQLVANQKKYYCYDELGYGCSSKLQNVSIQNLQSYKWHIMQKHDNTTPKQKVLKLDGSLNEEVLKIREKQNSFTQKTNQKKNP
ncbi:hypothetical protein PPERSA_06131 [Pseudocohnilembus persalinus]|uniref:Uncharacterized protein n=1 Tax=Pseudocohnilembus persalinus TaxID=266149 RepID=A0A0V0QV48_PSEPJ|nr:hypothetical protein PPERSA_06131 [Pseudocohnilembus persalinus]|eukprot:KRX06249.1 hypothetical protein PPERSA_06131 [Pseudocohnilembus persalinus]